MDKHRVAAELKRIAKDLIGGPAARKTYEYGPRSDVIWVSAY